MSNESQTSQVVHLEYPSIPTVPLRRSQQADLLIVTDSRNLHPALARGILDGHRFHIGLL